MLPEVLLTLTEGCACDVPAQAGTLQSQPSQRLEQEVRQGIQSLQEGVAWQGELTIHVFKPVGNSQTKHRLKRLRR